ncbi:exonuclease SbcCD subunit D C-terminal domain-containing protein, partial [Vibrio parahaemolyticus]|nr:exonuclease SbcCD subunit D C-terminal domain-containing protein [Vibrio parahaemolyticus]
EQQLSVWQDYQGENAVWLDIEVASQNYLADIQQRIEALTQNLPVEVVLLRRARKQKQGQNLALANETLNELTVEEVFLRRLSEETLEDPEREQRLTQLFQQSYDALRQEQG